jgi:hypothetical protein
MAGRIIWVHGMGEKEPPELERAHTWEALKQGLWCPIPENSYVTAYWADVIHQKLQAHETFPRPDGELLRQLPTKQRTALEWAYLVATLDRETRRSPTESSGPLRGWRVSPFRDIPGLRQRGWLALVDYVRDPKKLLLLPLNLARALIDVLWMILGRMPLVMHIARGFPIGVLLGDLGPYSKEGSTSREEIIKKIESALEESRKQPICLVAQSMGCIVALDAIRTWTQDCPECQQIEAPRAWRGPVDGPEPVLCKEHRIDTFVTLGSPLGLRWVRELVWKTRHLEYPPNVGRWFNLYDKSDIVSLFDRSLADDFRTRRGSRVVIDREVRPNFDPAGQRDPHNWYGYLSCPELADIISQFWLAANVKEATPLYVEGR